MGDESDTTDHAYGIGCWRTEYAAGDDALALLATTPLGRIIFTHDMLPAIQPVSHVVHCGHVIVRTHSKTALAARLRRAGDDGAAVTYQGDALDPTTRMGWSVVVTGRARLVKDSEALAGYGAALAPWIDLAVDCVVAVVPDVVTGMHLGGMRERDS